MGSTEPITDQLISAMNSPWVRLVLFILAIAGPLLAIFFYRKGRKEKLPRYDLRSNNVVRDLSGRYESLQMFYGGKQVQNLTVTRVILWNAGRETIRDTDVATSAPIVIRPVGSCSILDARVVQENNSASKFSISTGPHPEVRCQFEYLDRDQGAVVQVVHTGKSSSDLEIAGTIKEAGKLVRKKLQIQAFRERTQRYIVGASGLFLAVFMVCLGLIDVMRTGAITGLVLPAALGAFIAYVSSLGLVRTREVPKGLEAFGVEF